MNWKLWFVLSCFLVPCQVCFANSDFVIRSVQITEPVVALTFDDGPTRYTDDIYMPLDAVEKCKVGDRVVAGESILASLK